MLKENSRHSGTKERANGEGPEILHRVRSGRNEDVERGTGREARDQGSAKRKVRGQEFRRYGAREHRRLHSGYARGSGVVTRGSDRDRDRCTGAARPKKRDREKYAESRLHRVSAPGPSRKGDRRTGAARERRKRRYVRGVCEGSREWFPPRARNIPRNRDRRRVDHRRETVPRRYRERRRDRPHDHPGRGKAVRLRSVRLCGGACEPDRDRERRGGARGFRGPCSSAPEPIS